MNQGPTGVNCHICKKEVPWADLESSAAGVRGATAETVRSAILYGLVEIRHPKCNLGDGQ